MFRAKASPGCLDEWHFKNHLPTKAIISYKVKALPPSKMAQSSVSLKPDQWMVREVFLSATNAWTFWDHLPTKTIKWLKALSPWRPEQTCKGFPSLTDKQPFQHHIATKTIILTQSSVPWENGLKLSPRRPEQWMWRANASTGSLTNGMCRA